MKNILSIILVGKWLVAKCYLWNGNDLLWSIAERTWLTLLSPHPFLSLRDSRGEEEEEEEEEDGGDGEVDRRGLEEEDDKGLDAFPVGTTDSLRAK